MTSSGLDVRSSVPSFAAAMKSSAEPYPVFARYAFTVGSSSAAARASFTVTSRTVSVPMLSGCSLSPSSVPPSIPSPVSSIGSFTPLSSAGPVVVTTVVLSFSRKTTLRIRRMSSTLSSTISLSGSSMAIVISGSSSFSSFPPSGVTVQACPSGDTRTEIPGTESLSRSTRERTSSFASSSVSLFASFTASRIRATVSSYCAPTAERPSPAPVFRVSAPAFASPTVSCAPVTASPSVTPDTPSRTPEESCARKASVSESPAPACCIADIRAAVSLSFAE